MLCISYCSTPPPLLPLRHVLSVLWRSPFWLDWLVSESQDLAPSKRSNIGVAGSGFYMVGKNMNSGFSFLHALPTEPSQ